ncbi:MAG: hypothetical protein GY867_03310 [bacterium]|nr:hypothetical protein [bacterium]
MPCLEITMPNQVPDNKSSLAVRLTEAFASTTGFETEIFGIHFVEYNRQETASGGRLWDGEKGRPFIHFKLYCPRLRRTVKKELVGALTAAFAEGIGRSDWKPVIHICEHPYDNVGVNGELLSDSYAECADSRYYYDLPKD